MALPAPSDASTALVTGASSGIGAAIARELAGREHGVTLVARREEVLRDLAAELADAHGIHAEAVAADLSGRDGRERLAGHVEELGRDVEILVNNAGFGDASNFVEADHDRLMGMLQLNCEALLDLQARYLPAMVERGRGSVINIASTAAFQPLPHNATYAATKAFVLNLSEAVHEELRGSGVNVLAVCPGPVRTEFMEAAKMEDVEERTPGLVWMSADEVARDAVNAADRGKRAIVPGILNRAGALAGLHTPRTLSLPVTRRLWRGVL